MPPARHAHLAEIEARASRYSEKSTFPLDQGSAITMSTDHPENQPADQANPFVDNPYSPPDMQSSAMTGGPGDAIPRAQSPGMVSHVPIVSILMMVQGGLEVVMGLGLVAIGGFFPVMLQMDQNAAGRPQELPPEELSWVFLVMYGGLGVLTLIAAGLHIFAGIRNYQFRSRVLGIVALAGGLVTMFSCYCAPTAIGLGVYGLIVFLNPEATQAFALGESGKKRGDILAAYR